jgi:hypothetical protein
MKFSSQNETRINEFYKKGNTKPLLKENRILNEAIADEALAAEEMIAIFISNQNLTDSEIEKNLRKDPKDMSNEFRFIYNFFKSTSKTPIKNINEIISITINAIAKVRSFGLSSDASQFGTKKATPTTVWATKYNGESNPIMPKTDVLNSSKHHSVKQRGRIQVLDGSQKQVGALVLYTLDQMQGEYSKKLIKETQKEINEMQSIVAKLSRIPDEKKYNEFVDDFKKKNPRATADQIRSAAKKEKLIVPGGDIRAGKVKLSVDAKINLKEFENRLKLLDSKVNNIFSKLSKDVTKGSEFKRIFLTESLTGDVMFGKNNPASANSVITWDRNFVDLNIKSIPQSVNQLLPGFKSPKFETKSSGNWMTTVGKLTADLSKIQKQIDLYKDYETGDYRNFESVMKENISKVKQSKIEEMMMFVEYAKSVTDRYHKKIKRLKESLNEGIINEESFWEKMKNILDSVVNAVKKIGEKLSLYFSEMKDALYGTASDLFDFFGLEIQIESGYKVEVTF